MSHSSTIDFVAGAVSQVSGYIDSLTTRHGDRVYTLKDKWELEDCIRPAHGLWEAIQREYFSWRSRIEREGLKYDRRTAAMYREAITTFLALFNKLDERIKDMQRSSQFRVSCGDDVFSGRLQTEQLIKENWVPVAKVSSAFDEIELSEANTAALRQLLASAETE
jgi:hypothetical protein